MLKTLKVWNFALLEQVEINFTQGLNILTGETGAGKSILIDALGAILGRRLSVDMIRSGCEWLRVEAVFSFKADAYLHEFLEQADIIDDDSDELIVMRQLNQKGKNSITVNGCRVTQAVLKGLGELLVDIHGQNENLSLLKQESQFSLLDGSNLQIGSLRDAYQEKYQGWKRLQAELAEKEEQQKGSLERQEMLRWQQQEIEALQLVPGEDEQLEKDIKYLTNAEKISDNLQRANALLYGDNEVPGILSDLGSVSRCVGNLEKYDDNMGEQQNALEDIMAQLQAVAEYLVDYGGSGEFDEGRLDEMQERLSRIDTLKRKYGGTLEAVQQHLEKITADLEAIDNYEGDVALLQRKIAEAFQKVKNAAAALSRERTAAAGQLSGLIEEQLKALGMPDARFMVKVIGSDYTVNGADDIQMLFSANAGETEKPLAKVASGGELSRIALGIKAVASARDSVVESMVFDEIDTGIGGKTARMVAERVAQVACYKQVLCITHLPQIASMADTHFYICKKTQAGKTVTEVYRLQDGERTGEIARMASGNDVTAASLDNAREMIASAAEKKVKLAQKLLNR